MRLVGNHQMVIGVYNMSKIKRNTAAGKQPVKNSKGIRKEAKKLKSAKNLGTKEPENDLQNKQKSGIRQSAQTGTKSVKPPKSSIKEAVVNKLNSKAKGEINGTKPAKPRATRTVDLPGKATLPAKSTESNTVRKTRVQSTLAKTRTAIKATRITVAEKTGTVKRDNKPLRKKEARSKVPSPPARDRASSKKTMKEIASKFREPPGMDVKPEAKIKPEKQMIDSHSQDKRKAGKRKAGKRKAGKMKLGPDSWSDCGQVFFTGGKAYGICSNLRTVCIGTATGVQTFFEKDKIEDELTPAQIDALIEVKELREKAQDQAAELNKAPVGRHKPVRSRSKTSSRRLPGGKRLSHLSSSVK